MSVCIFFKYFSIAVILILTEPHWWGNDIDKYTPNQTINIRHTEWIFRCLELILQTEYFRYIVSLAPSKWCWNQTHVVIGLSITAWPEHSLSTTAHILALRWFVHSSISPQHTFLVIWSFVIDKMIKNSIIHDDVIKWKHFPRYWPLCHRWIPLTSTSSRFHMHCSDNGAFPCNYKPLFRTFQRTCESLFLM